MFNEISLNIHDVTSIKFRRDRSSEENLWIYVILKRHNAGDLRLVCFEEPRRRIALPADDTEAVLQKALALIRKAQERLCQHLAPDSSGDDRECLYDLLAMFDCPEQRAIESEANAAIAAVHGS
jgi:hypothetical protein